ncbi:hypothetical protein EF888_20525 [Silicimonas algicola]|uniref:Aspartate carbamoyltransferase catalytic subunit n=1 Tax=Silicimonas algicola TaxID=1826607 RepID=A0A316G8Q0_9RHOB|nr:hypothetical protein [Silicimonas algicola]AZQ69314.1 hypothetical protein EF888_20525 [Silicimonas algicola]PWK56376.1 hypothetical protein C8D95_10447 [Silicimonas algicola]
MTSDPFTIPTGERGVVRVFTTDLEPEGDAAITPGNLQRLLGPDVTLDAEKVEVFPSSVIEGLGLSSYLQEGYGVPREALSGKAAALDALSGLVILIPSSAFEGRTQVLEPNPGLRFVGSFREPDPEPPQRMAPAEAEDYIEPRETRIDPEPRQRMSSWVIALGALLIAAALVLYVVI